MDQQNVFLPILIESAEREIDEINTELVHLDTEQLTVEERYRQLNERMRDLTYGVDSAKKRLEELNANKA